MNLGSLTPLPGGWSGETFLADVGGERQVVRIHARRPERAEVDAALLHLVRGLLPVAEVLEVRRPDGDLPALLVTSFLPGVRGDLLLPDLDDGGLERLGRNVGDLVATLGGMPLPRAGRFLDGDLTIAPFSLAEDLPGYVASADLADTTGLADVAARAQYLLDTVDRVCLVHSDVNPKNLLIDPDTLDVTGLVDWEFAHAGHPFTDLGNVLRFERRPAYADAVLEAYADRRGTAPADALALARAADLWALVDLTERAGENPVADRAAVLLRGIAASGDPGWTPPGGPA